MKNNKFYKSPKVLIELERAENTYNKLPEVDWNNVDRDLLKQKTSAYNEVHRLRRLYFDRH